MRMITPMMAGAALLIALHADALGQGAAPEADTPPKPLTKLEFSDSDYPLLALLAHEEGTVLVDLLIGSDGTVADAHVAQSSGSEALDDATTEVALKSWRFEAAKKDGVPVIAMTTVEARWQLTEADQYEWIAEPLPEHVTPAKNIFRAPVQGSDYPGAALRSKQDGDTWLRYRVGTDGKVADVSVVYSSAPVSIQRAAERIVRRFRFEPARSDGMPIAVWLAAEIRSFVLPTAPERPACHAAPLLGLNAKGEEVIITASITRGQRPPPAPAVASRERDRWAFVSEDGKVQKMVLETPEGYVVVAERHLQQIPPYPKPESNRACWYRDPIYAAAH